VRIASWQSLVLFLLSLAYLGVGLNRELNVYDEGLVVWGAQRILEGDVPYRDFWSTYAPGQFYALAAAFWVFGSQLIVERAWDTLLRALLAWVSFHLALRLSSRGAASLAWAGVLLWLGYYEFFGYPVFPALLLGLSALVCLLRSRDPGRPAPSRRRWVAVAGTAVGLAGAFRHDFGFYALLACVPLLLSRGPAAVARTRLRDLAPFAVPLALVVLLVGLPFLAVVPTSILISDLVVFPATRFAEYRALPFPSLSDGSRSFPFLFPYLVWVATAGLLVGGLVRRGRGGFDESTTGALCLGLFSLVSARQAWIRADLLHHAHLIVVAFVLLAWLLGRASRQDWKIRLPVVLVLASLLGQMAELPIRERIHLFERGGALAHAGLSAGIERGCGVPVGHERARAIRVVQKIAPEGEPIFVGVGHHGRIFVNDMLFYFLAERPSATRFHHLHPGVATSAPVQAEIVRELEENGVRAVVLFTAFDQIREPNQSGIDSGVRVLDDYLRTRFRPVGRFGDYLVLARR
jgi:hypothetical protein